MTTPHLSHSEMVGGKILYSLYYFVYFYSITLHLLFCLDNSIVYNISIDVCNNKPCNDIIFSIFFLISIVYTNGFPYPSVQKFAQIHKNGLAKLNKILGYCDQTEWKMFWKIMMRIISVSAFIIMGIINFHFGPFIIHPWWLPMLFLKLSMMIFQIVRLSWSAFITKWAKTGQFSLTYHRKYSHTGQLLIMLCKLPPDLN